MPAIAELAQPHYQLAELSLDEFSAARVRFVLADYACQIVKAY